MKKQVIELYGLPGCGKTTIIEELSNQLGLRKISEVDFSFFRINNVYSIVTRFLIKLYSIIYVIVNKSHKYRMLLKIMEDIKYKNCINYFKVLLNFCVLIFYIEKGEGIILLDQGLVQAFYSLVYNEENPKIKVEEILGLISADIQFCPIYIKSDIGNISSRLSVRENGKSRIELESKKSREEINVKLINQQGIFENISKDLNSYIFINNNQEDITNISKNIVGIIENLKAQK